MLPLGFIIFVYFAYLLFDKNEKTFLYLFFLGFCYGFGFLIIYLSWIINPFLVYEQTKQYALLAILLPLSLSIFFGLFFCIFKFFKNQIMLILSIPFVFIFIEFFISNFIYGFPWISSSLILSNNFLGLYLLKIFGLYPSGYIILSIFLFPTFFYFVRNQSGIKKFYLSIFFIYLIILLISVYSLFKSSNNFKKELVIDAYQILKPIKEFDEDKIYNNIIEIIDSSKADYIIFAENNFPYLINNLNYLTNLTKDEKKIIFGATRIEEGNYYNSLLLIEKNKINYFDKQILVPFGEFLPFRENLNFMEIISGSVDFKSGNNDRVIATNDNLNILPAICYEIIFNKIFKNIEKDKIDIIINITNDMWFGNKIGPYQHFYIARTKASIANKPLVRVSNNGISAIIDNNGKLIRYSKLNQADNLNYNLKIKDRKNFFTFHKFYFYYLLITFIFLIFFGRKKIDEL